MKVVTTFAVTGEFEKALKRLNERGLDYETISALPAYSRVGTAALIVEPRGCGVLVEPGADAPVCSGWVDYVPPRATVPTEEPQKFGEDCFGKAAVMVLAPCVAEEMKIRLTAHLSGDLSEVFPYLNTEMARGSYNRHGPTFTYMDGRRMVCLYPRRITIAKADELVDGWRTLEDIRRRVNNVWGRRGRIKPSYEMRERPPALEIWKRLPRTDCRSCGQATCLAFAVKVWQGLAPAEECSPVFSGSYGHLREALVEVCSGLGVGERQ